MRKGSLYCGSLARVLGPVALVAFQDGCAVEQVGLPEADDAGQEPGVDDRAGGPDAPSGPGGAMCETAQRSLGAACGCAAECASHLCVDGVCCNGECTGACSACNAPGRMGTCSFVSDGRPPRKRDICPPVPTAGCGLDGMCDGEGHCRQHVKGTVCATGTCNGDAQVGIGLCDGRGTCILGSTTNCAPFSCDSSGAAPMCFDRCAADAQCAKGGKCVSGSCGKKTRGMPCGAAVDCATGMCADGVCCDVTCSGPCVSCNQVGHLGTCLPVKEGLADPKKVCADEGASTCGQTGACDGNGACAAYASGTVCRPGSCNGNNTQWTAEATCDGDGNCAPGSTVACQPFLCGAGGCLGRCQSDADCAAGRACVNGSCGLRANGQGCKAAADCLSNFCVDGVCCNDACAGACRSCALPAARGACRLVAGGAGDPRNKCADEGPASCGKDGTCTGDGSCHRYSDTTACGGESCRDGVYKPAPRCDGDGQCVPAASQACAPYVCNGDQCFTSCSNDAACDESYRCIDGSCGKKSNGADCSGPSECASGVCAQGVCCESACDGPCRSCALPGAVGRCKSVANGAGDPSGTCKRTPKPGCGTDGTCDGGGGCRRYGAGTVCKPAGCQSNGESLVAASTCDGNGTCAPGESQSCAPYTCSGGSCRTSCSADKECVAPNRCTNGVCGKRPLGVSCNDGDECSSGNCVNGACCAVARCGVCRSCNIAGQAGKCAAIKMGGADPADRCQKNAAEPCGNVGVCDGQGACLKAPRTKVCVRAGCTGSTRIEPGTCDGGGNCVGGAVKSCAPYRCDTDGTCRVSCTSDKHCIEAAHCKLMGNGKNTCRDD